MWMYGQAEAPRVGWGAPVDAGLSAGGSLSKAKKNFHKGFAPASPVFVLHKRLAFRAVFALLVAIFCGFTVAPTTAAAGPKNTPTAVKRQAASSQYLRAEEQRSALNSKPPEKRTLAEYKQAVASYRRVTLITPRAAEVPYSLLAVAELYTEMGDRFGRNYYQTAVDTYQFLVREYPTSKYCQDSLLRAAKLQREQLGDLAAATATYDAFVKRYPRSPRKREALEGMAEIALLQNGARTDGAAAAKNAAAATRGESSASAPLESAANQN